MSRFPCPGVPWLANSCIAWSLSTSWRQTSGLASCLTSCMGPSVTLEPLCKRLQIVISFLKSLELATLLSSSWSWWRSCALLLAHFWILPSLSPSWWRTSTHAPCLATCMGHCATLEPLCKRLQIVISFLKRFHNALNPSVRIIQAETCSTSPVLRRLCLHTASIIAYFHDGSPVFRGLLYGYEAFCDLLLTSVRKFSKNLSTFLSSYPLTWSQVVSISFVWSTRLLRLAFECCTTEFLNLKLLNFNAHQGPLGS